MGRAPQVPPLRFHGAGGGHPLQRASQQAGLQVNIEIMRAFVKLRSILAGHAGLARKLDALLRVPRSLEMKDPSAPVALGKQAQGKGKQRTEVLLIRRSKRLQVALSSLGRHRQIIAGPLGQGMLL